MDILSSGIPLGRYFGINVRLHWAFVAYAYWQVSRWGDLFYGLAFILGLYFCILLHEFGHALAARWCDGQADDILLWPLGGLAYCQPAWNPTAHLITTVAGPFVTLVLWLVLGGMAQLAGKYLDAPVFTWFLMKLSEINLFLLLFNLIPAFPMDGGRILRDTLWHWMRAVTATRIAVWCCRCVAVLAAVLILVPMEFWMNTMADGLPVWIWKVVAYCSGQYWLLLLVGFSFVQARREEEIVRMEAMGTYGFSVRERWKRGQRQRGFRQAVAERRQESAFHRCTTCGRTERDLTTLEFRVCSDCRNGEEYCQEHLENHNHV
jgi:Zn-dependent protease